MAGHHLRCSHGAVSPARGQRGTLVAHKVVGKVQQRLRRTHKPPAGGETLASKVVEHWRGHPESLAGLTESEIVRPDWVDQVLDGTLDPEPSAIAFVLNLTTASDDLVSKSW